VARQLTLGELDDSTRRAVEQSEDVLEWVLSRDLQLSQGRQLVIDEFERRYLTRILERHGGNVTHAARAAGVARRYFNLLRSRKLG
jgi:hypothetical protein